VICALNLPACAAPHATPAPVSSATPQASATLIRPTPTGYVTVHVSNYQFAPDTLTVKAGTQITWLNDGPEIHTVSSLQNGPLNSGPININEIYTFTFIQPGQYAYHCVLHPVMTGMITVTP
jgi:plastocyanin